MLLHIRIEVHGSPLLNDSVDPGQRQTVNRTSLESIPPQIKMETPRQFRSLLEVQLGRDGLHEDLARFATVAMVFFSPWQDRKPNRIWKEMP